MSFLTGIGLTSFGKHEGLSSLDLMSKAALAGFRPFAGKLVPFFTRKKQ